MKTLDDVITDLGDATEHLCSMMVSKETWHDALEWLKCYQTHIELDKLRDKCEAKNDPLTWDELKTMEGKPVWVEGAGYVGSWYIVECFDDNGGTEYVLLCGNQYWKSDMKDEEDGVSWQAYRKERK